MNVVSVITGIVTAIAGIAGIIVGIIKTLKNNENANNIPQGGNAGGPMPYPTHAQVYQAAHQQPQVVNSSAPVMQQYQAPVFPQYQMPYQAPVVRQTYYGPSMNTIEWPVPQMFNDAPMFQNWAYNYPSNGTTAWSQPANHQNNFPVIDTSVVDEMVNTMNRSRYVGNARPV